MNAEAHEWAGHILFDQHLLDVGQREVDRRALISPTLPQFARRAWCVLARSPFPPAAVVVISKPGNPAPIFPHDLIFRREWRLMTPSFSQNP
jgi:hypothetical protein